MRLVRGVGFGSRFVARCATALAVVALAAVGLTACSGSAEPELQNLEIAGGDTSGIYYNYAANLADAVSRSTGLDVQAAETHGSVENLQRVGSGKAILGFSQGDTAADAALGAGSFEQPIPVRAVARVYDEYVHIVVAADSDVRQLADLAGRRVSLGARDSGVQVIASRVLDAAGVGTESVANLALGLEESVAALQRGDLEAFFWVGGLPTPGIERLEESMPIRLLSVEADVVERVNRGHAGVYQFADFPVGFYDLQGSVVTMTVPNYLVTGVDAPDALIRTVLQTLFASRTEISRSVTAAGYLDRRLAIFTGPIELHPGAQEYFIETRH